MPSPDPAAYSIGAVSRLLDVPAATLRAWEERYAVVVPQRSPGGQRLFTRRQIEQLEFVREALRTGSSAADAHVRLRELLHRGGDVVGASPERSVLILLAAHDPYAAELAEYFLRTEGFEVVLTASGAETARLYGERRPSLVLVDLMIEAGRGVALCRELAARGARVVAVSAIDQRAVALDAGAAAFLRKPVASLELVGVVRDLLGTSALARSRAESTR